jgi:hypothetical protein
MKRRTTIILTAILLASGLFASQAEAYGGGGFYGSGRSDGSGTSDHASVGDGQFGRHQHAFRHIESYPFYPVPYEAGNYGSHQR